MTSTIPALQNFRECKQVKLPHAMNDQLMITLNISESSAKTSRKERLHYYGTGTDARTVARCLLPPE